MTDPAIGFFRGTSRGLRIGAVGFAITAAGAVVAVVGTLMGQSWLHWAAFAVACVGILVGFVGIALEWLWYRPPRGWVTTNYIVVGWVALVALPQLWTSLGVAGFLLVLLGGLSYTVGAVIHAAQRPDPWPEVFGYHELFHVFVLVALVLHFAAIAFVVLPKG